MSDQNITHHSGGDSGEMSSEDSEWLDRPDHPLLNDLILNSVLQHLGKRELKECRLVCKTWNELTIPYTRKTFQVNIHGHGHGKNLGEINTIEKFVNVFRSNELGIPFTRFQLGSFCTVDGGGGQKFLKLCGDTIKEIRFQEENIMVEDVSEFLKSTPSLEIFQIPMSLKSRCGNVVDLFPDGLEISKSKLTALKTLIIYGQNRNERNESCPTFVEELITAAQNISCLDMCLSQSKTSFEVLSLIEKLGRQASIQELEISVVNTRDYDDYVDLMLGMIAKLNGLRLKKFHYEAHYPHQEKLAIQVIPCWKDTLESLELNLHETHCPGFLGLPKMSRLTTITLALFPMDFKFRGFNLNENFPVLRELYLRQRSGKVNDEFFPDSAPCPNMNTFRLINSGMTINAFNQMLTVFPNLTQLSFGIGVEGVEILRQIWSQMTQLKSLDIGGQIETEDTLDYVLTGIPTHALEEMRHVLNDLERMMSEVERREMILCLRNQHSTLPSIGNLTNLSSLTIHLTGKGVDPSQVKFLTDLSGYFGFYSMKRLKQLKVFKCELTETCCEILRKDKELEFWSFSNSEYKVITPPVENR